MLSEERYGGVHIKISEISAKWRISTNQSPLLPKQNVLVVVERLGQ